MAPAVVCGEPGIGKTQFVTELYHRLAQKPAAAAAAAASTPLLRDGLVTVDLGTLSSTDAHADYGFRSALAAIGASLARDPAEFAAALQVATSPEEFYLGCIQRYLQQRAVLLCIDNVPNARLVRRLSDALASLRFASEHGPAGRVVLLTTLHVVLPASPCSFRLESLSDVDCRTLLLGSHVLPSAADDVVEQVLQLTGRHTLSLAALRYTLDGCQHNSERVDVLREVLADQAAMLASDDGTRAVDACLLTAWRRLIEPHRGALLRLCVWQGAIDARMAAAVLGDGVAVERAKPVLRALSETFFMVPSGGDGEAVRYEFKHGLAHAFLRGRRAAELDVAAQADIDRAQRVFVSVRTRELDGMSVRDASAVLVVESGPLMAAAMCWSDSPGLGILSKFCDVLRKCALYRQSEIGYRRVLALQRELQGERHPDTLSAMNSLAWTLSNLGDYAAARPIHEQVLTLRRAILGERHPNTLNAMSNLAATLSDLGDYAAARLMQEQVLALRREILSERHPDTLEAMNNLAATLYSLGDYAVARPMQEQVLALRREIQGDRHPDTLNAMNNLAATLSDLGDYADARLMQEQVLALRRELLGGRHPSTLHAMSNLAATLSDLGDYAAARPMEERVLAIRREILGERHRDTLEAMRRLAATLYCLGNYAVARPMQEQALALRREILGERDPDTLIAMGDLAATFYRLGDYAAARPMQEQVLALRREILGERHPDTLVAQRNLSLIVSRMAAPVQQPAAPEASLDRGCVLM
jgi:tetratricopeptide (TPR) repeat protein